MLLFRSAASLQLRGAAAFRAGDRDSLPAYIHFFGLFFPGVKDFFPHKSKCHRNLTRNFEWLGSYRSSDEARIRESRRVTPVLLSGLRAELEAI